MSASWSTNQKTWFKMPAHSWIYNPVQKNIESGDKILLHTGILHALMQRFGEKPLPHPLIFEIQNMKTRRISHCGVLEFSNEQSVAFLPKWMMLNLGLNQEGGEIQIKLKELPRCTSLILQPLKWNFGMIPTPKLALEHALRSFTALTVGDTITITIGGSKEQHSLIVKNLAPEMKNKAVGTENACCVVDAAISVDFLPPLEKEPEELKPVELTLGTPLQSEATANTYKYFRCKTLNSYNACLIEVTPVSGDPELVVSTQTGKPDLTSCTWKSVGSHQANGTPATSSSSSSSSAAASTSNTKRILINPTSIGFITGWYYIGVYAYAADTVFSLCVREDSPVENNASNSSSSVAAPSVGSLSSSDPNAKQCPNCRQYVSAKALSLHSVQCSRMNTYCERCAKPIRKSELSTHIHCEVLSCNMLFSSAADIPKHMDLVHKSIQCECGESIAPDQMRHHKQNDCTKRSVTCRFCSMELIFSLLAEHETQCGATSDPCERCGKLVPRRKKDIHLAVEHQINISLQPGDRNSMGIDQTKLKAIQNAHNTAKRDALGFIVKEEEELDENGKPKPKAPKPAPPPLTEDEALARAIAESLGQDDEEVRRAIEESVGGGGGGGGAAAASSSSAFTSSSSSSFAPTKPAAQPHHDDDYAEDDDFNDDDGAHDDDAAVETWDEDGQAEEEAEKAPELRSGEDDLCPYCNKSFTSFAALEKHMESCDKMDE